MLGADNDDLKRVEGFSLNADQPLKWEEDEDTPPAPNRERNDKTHLRNHGRQSP